MLLLYAGPSATKFTSHPDGNGMVPGKIQIGPLAQVARQRTLPFMLAIAIALLSMAAVWNDARHNAYIPCVENCGESFRVLKYVQDFQIYGGKFGFIEDYADERSPNRTPHLYTHNLNLPGILFAVLEAVGIHGLAAKQFFILLVHGLGLFYAFLSVRYLTGSSWLGVAFAGLLATDYELVFGFALNPLRAWHWLALFGLLYHIGHVVRNANLLLHFVACSIFAAIAFGVGYDYFAICLVISSFCVVLFHRAGLKLCEIGVIIVALVVAFLIPIALRQAQIAFVLGWNYWSVDFYYTLMTKAAFLQHLFPLPPVAQIEQFYRDYGVFRPPTAERSAVEMVALLKDLSRYVLLPLFGAMTLLVFAAATAFASAASIWRFAFINKKNLPVAAITLRLWQPVLLLIMVLSLGTAFGLAIFPDHNVLIFIKHKVPLIAAPVMFTKAVAIVWFAALARKALMKNSVAIGVISAALALLIVVDHAAIELDNIRAKAPYHFTWIDDVRRNPDATYAVSWDPTAVSVFTNTKVTSLSTRDELWLLDYLGQRSGRPPQYPSILRPDNLSALPDYWLYFPTDAMSPFDSFDPQCRLDYLSRFALSFVSRASPAILAGSSWVRPSPAKPGNFVIFGGKLNDLPFRDKYDLQLATREGLDGEVAMNCHHQTFQGWVRTSLEQEEGGHTVAITARDPKLVEMKTEIAYRLSNDAPPPDFEHPALILQLPMAAPDALSRRYPYVPVAARGPGWIMFDLRRFR
jgi:hypothetical protein